MKQTAQIQISGLKVAVPLPADALPRDLVPMEGPAGEPAIELVLAGSNLTAIAWCNGKNYRKMGTISRRISLPGQLFPQLLRGQLEELPEA